MKNDDNLLCAILRLILDDGDGSPSEVYVQKEFNCTNIFLGFGKSQVRTNPLCLHHEIEIGSFSGNWRIKLSWRVGIRMLRMNLIVDFWELNLV